MSKNKIALAAGILAMVVSIGFAGAQATRDVKASKYTKGYTIQPSDLNYTRDFVFSKTGDGIGAASRIYKDNREDVSEFVFFDEVGTERDGVEKAYANFTKHYISMFRAFCAPSATKRLPA